MYLNYGRYSNALAMLERQLQLLPDDPNTLVNKGYVCIQLGNYTQAVPPLSKAVALETNHSSEVYNTALLNLAIAYLKSDQLEAAQTNYETLQKAFPTAFRVYYGLGEIAYRKKDTNAAIRNYQLYLANARTNSDEARIVLERLKELKPTPPAPTQASDGKGKDVKPQ